MVCGEAGTVACLTVGAALGAALGAADAAGEALSEALAEGAGATVALSVAVGGPPYIVIGAGSLLHAGAAAAIAKSAARDARPSALVVEPEARAPQNGHSAPRT